MTAAIAMVSNSRSLVRRLIADRLRVDEVSIKDTDRLDALGLTPLDVVLLVLRFERFSASGGEFPVSALNHMTTVGDLFVLVELWLRRCRER